MSSLPARVAGQGRSTRVLLARIRLIASLLAVLTVGFGLTTPAAQAAVQPDDIGIMAVHVSPFNCGKTFLANNWAPGHNPPGSIDWQSHGGDAIGGEPVRATAPGPARFFSTLSVAGDVGIQEYGRYVVVTHGDGTRTRYAHLATMARNPGGSMPVSRGERIGTVGGSGGPYAPHLHYEQITAGGEVDRSPTVEGVTVPLGERRAIRRTC
jgi:hypothetical protein